MAINRIRRCHGRAIAAAVLVVSGPTTHGMAETTPTYDKRIEEAAIRMLIPKLGDMRGGLELKSNEYLRPLANETVIESPQAAMIPTPVEKPRPPESRRAPKDRKVITSRHDSKDLPTVKAIPAPQSAKLNEDQPAKQAAPKAARRSEGSFLFF
ncbi:hypothetical protein SAMN05877838_2595 [Hoeflea halophila]|uniref:Uncharacterized protein n=1 Tax=Hoeflea halophila TaxID=714899 RepID=A0A286ICA7_9HYPH|nr:hypothetical protein [Hoeflea halophila]SOE17692.1 hypothetical protein SAMN05877838_2595 [Hoeflea halophila]